MPEISIIVPVYGVEKYLDKCVNSILNQTFTNFELILVDDGSKDNCPLMCEQYKEKDNRVRVIHKENGGLSDARNAGIEVATGKYIGFVDSDDYISYKMYEALYNAIEKNSADLSMCNFMCIGEDEFIEDNDFSIPEKVMSGIEILDRNKDDEKGSWVVAWNKLYKKELFKDIRYPVGKIHEDEFVYHKIMVKCKKVACVSEPLYFYLQRNNSIMKSDYSVKRLDRCEALLERGEFLLNKVSYKTASFILNKSVFMWRSGFIRLNKNQEVNVVRLNELKKKLKRLGIKLLFTKISLKTKRYLLFPEVFKYKR